MHSLILEYLQEGIEVVFRFENGPKYNWITEFKQIETHFDKKN